MATPFRLAAEARFAQAASNEIAFPDTSLLRRSRPLWRRLFASPGGGKSRCLFGLALGTHPRRFFLLKALALFLRAKLRTLGLPCLASLTLLYLALIREFGRL